MSTIPTKAMASAFGLALLATTALAQPTPPNPAASPVQGAHTGTARSADTTSPATTDPALRGSQTTDGRSPGTMPGSAAGRSGDDRAARTAAPLGVQGSSAADARAQTSTPATTSGTAGQTTTGQPTTTDTRITNDPPGGSTGMTNAPVGAAMDGSRGGQAATRNDSDRAAGTAPATGSAITNAPPGTTMGTAPGTTTGTTMGGTTGTTGAPPAGMAGTTGMMPGVAPPDGQRRDGAANVSPAGVQPGANSFTEGQARSRMEDAGFAQVGELRRDDNGIWRGRAMREGRSVEVMMDFRGNVTHQ